MREGLSNCSDLRDEFRGWEEDNGTRTAGRRMWFIRQRRRFDIIVVGLSLLLLLSLLSNFIFGVDGFGSFDSIEHW